MTDTKRVPNIMKDTKGHSHRSLSFPHTFRLFFAHLFFFIFSDFPEILFSKYVKRNFPDIFCFRRISQISQIATERLRILIHTSNYLQTWGKFWTKSSPIRMDLRILRSLHYSFSTGYWLRKVMPSEDTTLNPLQQP